MKRPYFVLPLILLFALLSLASTTCNKPVVENGVAAPEDATLETDEIYTITCGEGFTMAGSAAMVCQDDGAFSQTPTCPATACPAPTITDGTLDPADATTVAAGETYAVTCGTGFTINGSPTMTCEDGNTFDATPTCETSTCDKPDIENATITPDEATVNYGAAFTAACETGFSLDGSATMTCADGNVFDATPTCEIDTCEKPTIAQGTLTPDEANIEYGSLYTLACAMGYDPSAGTLLCGAGGSLPTTTCEIVTCDKPTVEHGSVLPEDATVDYEESYDVTCDTGYEITEGDGGMLCDADGTLSNATCDVLTCDKPTIDQGIITPDQPTVDHGNHYTLSCNAGYTPSTTDLECLDDGTLTVATCPATACASPTISDGTVTPADATITTDAVYTIACATAFSLTGSEHLTCEDGNTFAESNPTCDEVVSIAGGSTVNAGEGLALTCTYTTSTTGSAATVAWSLEGDAFNSTQTALLSDGGEDSGNSNSVYTVTSAAISDMGEYSCSATYDASAIIPAVTTSAYVRSVVLSPEDPFIVEGSSVTLTCTASGDAVSAIEWTPGDAGTVDEGSYDNVTYEWVSTMTIASVAESTDISVRVTYSAGSVTVEDQTSLTTLGIHMGSSTTATAVGGLVTITCNYDMDSSASSHPTVSWTLGTTDFTNAQLQAVSVGDNCDDTQRKRYTISYSALNDTGNYKCKATFDDGTFLQATDGVEFYVRTISSYAETDINEGGTATLSCTISGDDPPTFNWLDSTGSTISTGGSYTVTAGDWADYSRTSTLTVASATQTDHEGNFTCSVAWDDGAPTSLTSTKELQVYVVTGLSDTTEVQGTIGDEQIFTCSYETSGNATVTWFKSGSELTSGISEGTAADGYSKSLFTIASLNGTHSGIYSCKVVYSSIGDTYTGTNTKSLKVRGVSADSEYVAPDGAAAATIICIFYGDEMTSFEWSASGAELTDDDDYDMDDGTYDSTNNYQITTLTVNTITTSDAKAYTCEATYSDAATKSAIQTLKVLNIEGISTSDAYASSGDTVTITCSYTLSSASISTAWTRGDDTVTAGAQTPGSSTSEYKIEGAGATDNGNYKCYVTFEGYSALESVQKTQYVRDVAASAPETYSVDGDSTVTLTCIFRGDALSATTWYKSGAQLADGTNYTITAGTMSSYTRTDTLTIKEVVADDAGTFICNATYTQGSTKTGASQILYVLEVSSLTSSNTNSYINVFSSFTLTCTHNVGDSTPTVTWSLDGTTITGSTISTSGTTMSILSVSSATTSDNGKYKCLVDFGTYGSSYKEYTQYIRSVDGTSTNYALSGADTYDITCTFYGDALGDTAWTHSSATLTDSSGDYNMSSTTNDYNRVDVLTVNDVDSDSSGVYTCTAAYSADSTSTSKELRITVLEISSFTSSSSTLTAGSALTITCQHTSFSDDTITWYKDDVAFTSGIDSSSSTKSFFTASSASSSDNGVYKCAVAFGTHGTQTSSTISQYVRYATPSGSVYGVTGSSITITCTFYGDALGAASWYKGSNTTALTTTGDYTVTAGTYASMTRADTLTIASLDSSDASNYTCNATYSADNVIKSSKQKLTVTSSALSVTVARTSSDDEIDSGDNVVFTCTYTNLTLGSGDGSISVAWTFNSATYSPTVTTGSLSETFTITSATYSANGVYKCTVSYGVYGDISSSNTLLVRAVQHTANLYMMTGASLTLTCASYGDEFASITWTKDSSSIADGDVYTIAEGTYSSSTYLKSATVVIDTLATSNAGSYLCAVVYASPAKTIEQTAVVAVAATISTPTLTADTVDAGETASVTCAFTSASDASLSSAPTVTIYKGSTSLESTEINGTSTASHTYEISNSTTSNSGSYKCLVEYGDYGTKNSSDVTFTVRDQTDAATHYIISGESTTLTCTFQGDEMDSVEWSNGNETLSSDDDYTITTGDYSSSSYSLETTLLVSSVSASANYTCQATYTDDSEDVSSVQEVVELGSSAASSDSDNIVSSGSSFTITATYSTSYSGSTTVAWTKDGSSITNGTSYTITTADGTSTVAVSSAGTTNMGTYQSTATYGSVGSSSSSVTIYVNAVVISSSKTYSAPGATVTLSCVFYGDLDDDTASWYKDSSSTAISTDSSYTVKAGTASDNMRTDKLVLNTVDSLDSATYTCNNTDSSGTQTLNIISITTSPSSAMAMSGEDTTMSCVTLETIMSITEISWSDGSSTVSSGVVLSSADGDNSGYTVYKSTLTITGSTSVTSKNYTCTVKMPNDTSYNVTSSSATFYTAGVKTNTISGTTGDYIESSKSAGDYSEQYTVKFNIFVGPGLANVTTIWNNASSDSNTTVSFSNSTATSAYQTFSYTPAYSAHTTGTYYISSQYTGFNGTTFTNTQAVYVYQYCKISSLSSISNGAWSPTTKVDYKSYATLSCSSGYYVTGSSKAQCGSGGSFSIDTTPTCASSTSLSCGNLTATDNGYVTYSTGTTSSGTYDCDSGYTLLGDAETYTCDSTTGTWSIVTSSNPSGTPPVCQETVAAASRSVSFTLTFSTTTEYCSNSSEDSTLKTALTSYLETNSLANCLVYEQCEMSEYDCSWSSDVLTVTFTLNQLTDLNDPDILSDDATAISEDSFVFSVGSKRRKRSLSLSSNSSSSTTSTSCDSDYISVDDACVQCATGYGLSSASCAICSKGYYSNETSISACTACSTNYTTTSTGSDSSSDCIESSSLCTVPTADDNGSLSPPAASTVSSGTTVTASCNSGYKVQSGVSSTFNCTGSPTVPTCYMSCNLSSYTQTKMKDELYLQYSSVSSVSGSALAHEETLNVTCLDGYQYWEGRTWWQHECEGDDTSSDTTITLTPCSKIPLDVMMIGGALAGVIVVLLIILLLTCCCKGGRKRPKPQAPVSVHIPTPKPVTPPVKKEERSLMPEVAMPTMFSGLMSQDQQQNQYDKIEKGNSSDSSSPGVLGTFTGFFS